MKVSTVNKVFGDLVYEMSISEYENDYRIYEFKKAEATVYKDKC